MFTSTDRPYLGRVFFYHGAVGFIIQDKICHPKCRSFRAAVKKSPALMFWKIKSHELPIQSFGN